MQIRPPNDPRTRLTQRLLALQREAVAGLNALQTEEVRWRLLMLLGRYSAHIAILSVLAVGALLASTRLNGGQASAGVGDPGTPAAEMFEFAEDESGYGPRVIVGTGLGNLSIVSSLPQNYVTQLNSDSGIVSRLALASTAPVAIERQQVVIYTVKPNDNVETIANLFGQQPTSIIWSNPELEEEAGALIQVGQKLVIPPVNGVYHTVQAGDTLDALAKRYKVRSDEITSLEFNQLKDGNVLLAGRQIIVPNGIKPEIAPAVRAGTAPGQVLPSGKAVVRAPAAPRPAVVSGPGRAATGAFSWPTQGVLTQGYWRFHNGYDIAASIGTPLRASDNGYVTVAQGGWNFGYGTYAIVDHRNGFSTLYGHMSVLYVSPGQTVSKGQVIGLMGSSGRSTGPHVHFEVRYNGNTLNPALYLR